MRVPELTTRRLALVGAFLLVFGVTTVAFAQAVTGHLAAIQAPNSDVTVVDYDVTDDDGLDVTVRVHNPTVKDVELAVAQVNAYADDEQVSDGTTTRLDDVIVGSESTRNVTIPLDLRDDGAQRLRNADAEQVEIRGRFKSYVVEETVYISVGGMEVGE